MYQQRKKYNEGICFSNFIRPFKSTSFFHNNEQRSFCNWNKSNNWSVFITEWKMISVVLLSFFIFFIVRWFFPKLFLNKSPMESIFPGIWKNEWTYTNPETHQISIGYEIFEIKNKNEYNTFKEEQVNGQYIYDEKPRFKIIDFEFEKGNKKKFSFLKKKVGQRWHIYEDYVEKINSNLIQGEESNYTTVKFTRIK